MALDHLAIEFGSPQRRASTPPTSAWSTPSSRRSRWMRSSGVRASPWTCSRIAGIRVDEHQLADVVQQRGDHQPVARLVADLAGDPVGRALGGDAVQPEALGDCPARRRCARRSRTSGPAGDRRGRCAARAPRPPGPRSRRGRGRGPSTWLARAQDRDGQRHVGLDRGDHVGRGRLAVLEQAQHAVARLGQHRERLERLERSGQPASVALVVMALARGVWVGRRSCGWWRSLPLRSASCAFVRVQALARSRSAQLSAECSRSV